MELTIIIVIIMITISYYYCYFYHCLMYLIPPYLRRATDTVPVPVSQRNFMDLVLAGANPQFEYSGVATVQVHSLLTVRKPSEHLPPICLCRGNITCLALQRRTPVAVSCPPERCWGNRKKENQKRRLSSLEVPNTISLIPSSLWDLTRK